MATAAAPRDGPSGAPSGAPPAAAELALVPAAATEAEAAACKEAPAFLTDRLFGACPLDALPYVDPLPAEQQQEVQQLLQQEMAAIAKENGGEGPPDYLADFAVPQTPRLDDGGSMLGKELQRKANGECIPELDLEKYNSFSRPSGQKATDLKEWGKCVAQCQQLLQHAAVAHVNLELMVAHAAPSWQRHLKNLSQTNERLSLLVKRKAEESDSICKTRKVEQVEAAATLKQLQQSAAQYTENNKTILEALGPLTKEVAEVKAKCRMRGILPDYAEEDELDLDAWQRAAGIAA
ncbi:hypothetical protein Efla_006836 [Eimeria flavescens]